MCVWFSCCVRTHTHTHTQVSFFLLLFLPGARSFKDTKQPDSLSPPPPPFFFFFVSFSYMQMHACARTHTHTHTHSGGCLFQTKTTHTYAPTNTRTHRGRVFGCNPRHAWQDVPRLAATGTDESPHTHTRAHTLNDSLDCHILCLPSPALSLFLAAPSGPQLFQ